MSLLKVVKSWPVRPNPVAISSAMSRMSWRSQISRTPRTTAGSWNRMPPVPCTTGSMMTAAVRSVTMSSKDSR